MKKISLFLTLTMLCSMLVMPIHSSAAGKIFEEDFESYSSVSRYADRYRHMGMG